MGKRYYIKRWKLVEADYNSRIEEMWFKGRRVRRVRVYGTLSNPHAPSRWRTAGYLDNRGVHCVTMKEALKGSAL